tara:strand:+ start:77 stop:1933 length:1857 start_codon:yes stop_codon:yes gene_type:complete
MSFIVTSNSNENQGGTLTTGLNTPFSYHNYLSSTMNIPKDSEIALQSVKINREGAIQVNRQNNQFYYYNGQAIGTWKPLNETTNAPILSWISDAEGSPNAVYNTDDLAEAFGRALRRSVVFPHLQLSDVNVSGASCIVQRNGSSLDFEGFNFSITSASSGTNSSLNIPQNWQNAMRTEIGTATKSTPSGSQVKWTNSTSGDSISKIGYDYPLSNLNGCCVFEVNASDNSDWVVGLTRCTRTHRNFPAHSSRPAIEYNVNLEAPPYFDKSSGHFFDWEVGCYSIGTLKYLQPRHAVWETSRLVMRDYGSPYEFHKANASQISFNIKGERMLIQALTSAGGVAHTFATGINASMINNAKPMSVVTCYQFPKIAFGGGASGTAITLKAFDGVKIDNFIYGGENPIYDTEGEEAWKRQVNQDWYATQINLSVRKWIVAVESRYMFKYSEATATTTYAQVGLNNSGQFNGTTQFFNRFIFTNSSLYKVFNANVGGLLGFSNNGVVEGHTIQSTLKTTWISPEIPKFLSTNSMFVRLSNLAQQSFNFSKGSISKIIYHLPRFDNAGNEVGGLFFEPSERVYLDLNNANDLKLNDLNIEIVNSDETLASNLTGKTIVCLHIRKKK